MISALIFQLVALQSVPAIHAFVPTTPTPVTITSDNVELDGAGGLKFEPDPRAFYVEPPAGGDGAAVTVRLWLDLSGAPLSCDIGQAALQEAALAGCSQLMRSAKFQLSPGMALPFRRGFVDVKFSFFKDPPGGPAGIQMFANVIPAYANTTIIYPADNTPAEQFLQRTDGSFSVAIMADDYPSIALRYGMESRSSVLLGIGRDGKVRDCRPVSANAGPNTAFLDNYTCSVFMRRGHFEFLPAVQDYSGLRYWRQNINWKIPS